MLRSSSRLALVMLVAFLGYSCHRALQPPSPNLCGSATGPPITSPRIRLRDGRHLAYRELGIPRQRAAYKIVFPHGLGDTKEYALPVSRELVEEMGLCFVLYDRPGYGESDPNPSRSPRSEALDIEQLADELGFGRRFYVIGASMGAYPVWACLHYIPHRLAGVALVTPMVNFWWPSFPSSLREEALQRQLLPDRWMFRIAHYAPSLFHWWTSQKWFRPSAILVGDPQVFNPWDKLIIDDIRKSSRIVQNKAIQQSKFESICRDILVAFSPWEFDPMELKNPFPENEGGVHIWVGGEDRIVPCSLQKFLAGKLPWMKYYEVPNGGHFFLLAPGMFDRVVRTLLLGDEGSPASQ